MYKRQPSNAEKNVVIGHQAGYRNGADKTVIIGNGAGRRNINDGNVFIGSESGYNNLAPDNTFVGYQSGRNNTYGHANVFIGSNCASMGTGSHNVMIGDSVGYSNSNSQNTFIGSKAGRRNGIGGNNVSVGFKAGYLNSESFFSVNIGSSSGESNKFGGNNVNVGYQSGFKNESNFNTNIGAKAGSANVNGTHNVNLGYNAGRYSLSSNNVNIGSLAGEQNTMGGENVNIGPSAGKGNLNGVGNVCVGFNTGLQNRNSFNTLIGTSSGKFSSGLKNTYLGYQTGMRGGGSRNVFIGYQAGENEHGSDKLYIDNSNTNSPLIGGSFADNHLIFNVEENGGSLSSLHIKTLGASSHLVMDGNEIDTHNSAMFLNNNTDKNIIMVSGGGKVGIDRVPSTNALEVNGQASKSSAGDWLANSDARLKKNIQHLDSDKMLEQIVKMQGVVYEWNDHRPEQDRPYGKQYGFLAQDIQKVWPENVSKDAEGYLQTAYGTYDHLYVEAIKALNNQNMELKIQLDLQNKILEKMNLVILELKSRLIEVEKGIK